MGAEENKAIVRRLYREVFCRGDEEALREIAVPEFANHSPQLDSCQCRDGYWEVISQLRAAVPDLEIRVEDEVAAEDKVACRVTVSGTFVTPYGGIFPTGGEIVLGGIAIFRLEGGRVVEGWSHSDPLVGSGHLEHRARRGRRHMLRPAGRERTTQSHPDSVSGDEG
jgi:predicted ester cyclase